MGVVSVQAYVRTQIPFRLVTLHFSATTKQNTTSNAKQKDGNNSALYSP